MLSDERLKELARGGAPGFVGALGPCEVMIMARELLAIRERQASAYAGAAPDAFTDAMERAVLGLPPPAPQRLYSEEELRLTALEVELCAPWQSERARDGFKSGWQETMRRLRGGGEAKPVCPKCGKTLASFAHLPGVWRCMNDDCDRWDVHPSEVGGATP